MALPSAHLIHPAALLTPCHHAGHPTVVVWQPWKGSQGETRKDTPHTKAVAVGASYASHLHVQCRDLPDPSIMGINVDFATQLRKCAALENRFDIDCGQISVEWVECPLSYGSHKTGSGAVNCRLQA